MTITVRRATESDEDRLASSRLSEEAFGYARKRDAKDVDPLCVEGRTTYVAERDGTVVGKCVDRHYESWFGGKTVATSGVASVTVQAEERGQGTMTQLVSSLMAGARARGASVSTLVPTAPGAYRALGYETITTFDFLRVPTAQLGRVRPGAGSTRRATVADWPVIEELYDTWASAQNGPLTRRGPSFGFTPEEVLGEYAFTLAFDTEGEPVGYASWKHVGGYYSEGRLETGDILATTVDGYRLLLAAVGSSYAVAPTTELMSSGLDQLRLVLPDRPWQTYETDHYMLAVLSVEEAFSARGYAGALDLTVGFSVAGATLEGVDGAYELEIAGGDGSCRRVGDVDWTGPVFTAGGLAMLFAGAQSCANIAMVGGLAGETGEDEVLDMVFGGRQVHIRDSF